MQNAVIVMKATKTAIPLERLLEQLPDNYTLADRELIQRAYRVAEEAHRDQKRHSGEPYINHCLAVASILADLRVPPEVVAAGLVAFERRQLDDDLRALLHHLAVGPDHDSPLDVLGRPDRVLREVETRELLAHPISRLVAVRGDDVALARGARGRS